MKKTMILTATAVFLTAALFAPPVQGQARSGWFLDVETGGAFLGYCDVQIPGDTGTRFSLTDDLESSASAFFRLRAGLNFRKRHTLWVLLAPLSLDTVLDLDADAAEAISRSLYAGGSALKAVLPEEHPVLWPEHFDVAVTDNEVNYGVSAGDDGHPLPYAYVGPWDFAANARTGRFWNASFGALYPLDLSADVDTLTGDVAEFFRRGQAQL